MKKNSIRCRSRLEMQRIADRMIEQGYSVKAEERVLPFLQYGICIPSYKVVFWKENEEKPAARLCLRKQVREGKEQQDEGKAAGKHPVFSKTALADTGAAR